MLFFYLIYRFGHFFFLHLVCFHIFVSSLFTFVFTSPLTFWFSHLCCNILIFHFSVSHLFLSTSLFSVLSFTSLLSHLSLHISLFYILIFTILAFHLCFYIFVFHIALSHLSCEIFVFFSLLCFHISSFTLSLFTSLFRYMDAGSVIFTLLGESMSESKQIPSLQSVHLNHLNGRSNDIDSLKQLFLLEQTPTSIVVVSDDTLSQSYVNYYFILISFFLEKKKKNFYSSVFFFY
jgi:hypothetical protein